MLEIFHVDKVAPNHFWCVICIHNKVRIYLEFVSMATNIPTSYKCKNNIGMEKKQREK